MSADSVDIPLRDIKPLWEIVDFSFFVFMGMVGLFVALLFLVFFWLRGRVRAKREHGFRLCVQEFVHLTVSNPKEFAYQSTEILGGVLSFLSDENNPYLKRVEASQVEQTQENIRLFLQAAQEYKYKKEVDSSMNEAWKKTYDNLVGDLYAYI